MPLFDTVYPSQNPADAEGVKLGAQRIRELKDALQVLLTQLFNDDTTLKSNSLNTAQLIDKAVTLAKMADGVRGNLITFNSSLRPILLALGASGFFLKSNGADLVFSALTATDINVAGVHGVPNFIAPVTVFGPDSTAAPDWTTFDCSASVPAGASAVILQADWGTGVGAQFIYTRPNSSGQTYVLGRGAALGSGDSVAGSQQGIFPFATAGPVRSFDYKITATFDGGANIRLVGYVS